jgi:hypothetical protein
MTNKLKGILTGFLLFFIVSFLYLSDSPDLRSQSMDQRVQVPFFWALIGAVIGFLVGSSIKEK